MKGACRFALASGGGGSGGGSSRGGGRRGGTLGIRADVA